MLKYLKLVVILSCSIQSFEANTQDVFRFSPTYKFTGAKAATKNIYFISYKPDSQLRNIVSDEGNDGPLFILDKLMSAASNEEKNAITLENSDRPVVDSQKMIEKSIRYKSGLVRIFVNSQFLIEHDDELYSYVKYRINFPDELLDSIPELDGFNNIYGLKVAVKKNDKWLLTKKHPIRGLYLSYLDCPTNIVTEILTGVRLVNGKSVISLDGILDINRLVKGMTDELVEPSDTQAEIAQDTVSLSYSLDREIEQIGYWVYQEKSYPVHPSHSITEYSNDQFKLFLSVHRAIIHYTAEKDRSSMSLKNDNLHLDYDLISKTHMIKYGYCDVAKKKYIFRIERNGPFEIKSFTVCVNVVGNEFVVEFRSDIPAFNYVNYISSSLHRRLSSYKFGNDEENTNLSELKTICMGRVGFNTIIDFECFSNLIEQLPENQRNSLRN